MATHIPDVYDTTVIIDGKPVPAKVRRFTLDEAVAFNAEFSRIQKVEERSKLALASAKDDDAFDAVLDRQAKDEARAKTFLASAIRDYITIAPGHVYRNDSDTVTSGEDLVLVFGGRSDVLTDLLMAIYVENTVGGDLKKTLKSVIALSAGSLGPLVTVSGDKPAAPVGSASPAATAPPAAAMGKSKRGRSGETASAPSRRARSSR